MTTSSTTPDHPLSPTLSSNHGSSIPGTQTTIKDDPLSPRVGDDDEEEERNNYNRINSHPIRDISLNSTYSESEDNSPYTSSKRTSNDDLEASSSNGKVIGKVWIAGTASTERLTTSSESHRGDRGMAGYKPKQRQMSATSSVDGSTNAASDEDEKNVQANLERWAAEERQRRKAARSSRTSSMLAPPGGSLARRLSHLGRKQSTSKPNHGSTNDHSNLPSHLDRNGNDALLRRSSRTESVSSIETNSSNGGLGVGPQQNGNGLMHYNGGESSLEDVPEAESSDAATERGFSPRRSNQKGKGRALDDDGDDDGNTWNAASSPIRQKNDPFRDPTEFRKSARPSSGDDIYSKSNSHHHHHHHVPVKPTATRPIVTVGRSPSIALRHGNPNNPSIVQTDHDAEKSSSNPFEERSQPPRAASSGKGLKNGGNRRNNRIILEGDENEELRAEAEELELARSRSSTNSNSTITGKSNPSPSSSSSSTSKQPRPISSMAPPRKSTSSSRFNELDISDVEEDIDERSRGRDNYTDGPSADKWTREERKRRERDRIRNQNEMNESERERDRLNRTWWTDWICGCGPRDDEDEEQAGKTMPDL